MRTTPVATLFSVLLVACATEPTTPTDSGQPLIISHAGNANAQTVLISSEFPEAPTVLVTQNGVPKAGITVAWSHTTHPDYPNNVVTGIIDPATSVTDATGRASTKWRLGPSVGTQQIKAAISGDTSARVVVFVANAVLGSPAYLTKYTGDNQILPVTAPNLTSLGVSLNDQYGHNIWEAKIKWTVISGPVTMASADDYKYWSPLVSRRPYWTGGVGTALVRAEAIGTGITTDFTLTVAPVLSPVSRRPGPPYLIRIKNHDTRSYPFYSVQNGRGNDLVDTIPVGASIVFGDETRVNHPLFTILGLPGLPAGLVVPLWGEAAVTFPVAGTYPYTLAGFSNGIGRVVVQ